MDDVDRREVLRAIPLFAEALDEAQLGSLAARCHLVTFPKGAEMMTEGEFGSSMFAIIAGTVAVTVADRRGTGHDVAHLGAGDIVGEMALMTGARRSATVVVSDEVAALEITKVALEQILARAPDLIDRFGEILARRQGELDRVAKEHGGEDFAHRIRHFFTRR